MKEPTPGEMDKCVWVKVWQDEPAGTTDVEQTYHCGFRVWASLLPTGAALFYGTAQVESGVTHRLATWRTSRMNADVIGGAHVVEHGCMRYRVRRATDIKGGRMFVLLDLEQLGSIKP